MLRRRSRSRRRCDLAPGLEGSALGNRLLLSNGIHRRRLDALPLRGANRTRPHHVAAGCATLTLSECRSSSICFQTDVTSAFATVFFLTNLVTAQLRKQSFGSESPPPSSDLA